MFGYYNLTNNRKPIRLVRRIYLFMTHIFFIVPTKESANTLAPIINVTTIVSLVLFAPKLAIATSFEDVNKSIHPNTEYVITATSYPFSIRLFLHENNLVLRLPNGYDALFEKSTSRNQNQGNNIHHHEFLGEILTNSTERIWSIDSDFKVVFRGSYPIKYISKNHATVSLKYRYGKLLTYTLGNTDENNSIGQKNVILSMHKLIRNAETLSCPAELHDEQPSLILEESVPAQSPEDMASCDESGAPLPVGFGEPTNRTTLQINARPSDCNSYFTAYADIDRGTEIEEALSEHNPYLGSESGGHSFPVADYWNNGNVFVLISRDLTADSYDTSVNSDGLYDQLMQDGENIHENLIIPLSDNGEITHTELGVTTTLHASDAQVVYLDVVIQYGVMTPQQQAVIDQAATELLDTYGIVLRIIEIP